MHNDRNPFSSDKPTLLDYAQDTSALGAVILFLVMGFVYLPELAAWLHG